MLLALNRITHRLPRPDHFGPFPPRRVRRHVGQAVVRRPTAAPKSRQVDLLSINSSAAQDERNGHPAFLSLHVCPSPQAAPLGHSLPEFNEVIASVSQVPLHSIPSFASLPLPLYPTIDPSPLSFSTRVDSRYGRYPGRSDGWLGRSRSGPSSPYGLGR